jgi:hypothetical protein
MNRVLTPWTFVVLAQRQSARTVPSAVPPTGVWFAS